MKYLSEFRDPTLVSSYLEKIFKLTSRKWNIMEVCGGQTHSLVKNGIIKMLPEKINMIHGPGCPVCVTPMQMIDHAVELSLKHDVIMCSYGDMLRVPGSHLSLLQAKARGGDVRITYSPLEAVRIAIDNPDKQVVFFAVGFETTAPANALSVLHAAENRVHNYSLLVSHVLVPPAIEAVLNDPLANIHAVLAAGHVCTIMGVEEYAPLVARHKIPIVVTGFEPVDLLHGIWMAIKQLEAGDYKLENQYARVVKNKGNTHALEVIRKVFMIDDREWRGIGDIPSSGYELRSSYHLYDAKKKFNLSQKRFHENAPCQAGQVLKGIIKPFECPEFGRKCTPSNPLGAPMVSSEGACAAYYHYERTPQF